MDLLDKPDQNTDAVDSSNADNERDNQSEGMRSVHIDRVDGTAKIQIGGNQTNIETQINLNLPDSQSASRFDRQMQIVITPFLT